MEEIRLQRTEDAHEVAAALLRLADSADERGKVSFLDEKRRRELAKQLHSLADALDPNGRTFAIMPVLYLRCPLCDRPLQAQLAQPMHCQCGRVWDFGLRLREDAP